MKENMNQNQSYKPIDNRWLQPPPGTSIACWLLRTGDEEGTTTTEEEANVADSAEPLIFLRDHLAAVPSLQPSSGPYDPPDGIEIVCWWLTYEDGRHSTTTNECVADCADSAEALIRLSDHIAVISKQKV